MCKSLERRYERELDADLPYVIRLDGVHFKRLTARLSKPFDAGFTRAMLLTARDLLEWFAASTVFVQSDEVSLFMLPRYGPIPYNGRCQKISSVAAGIASARFNQHFGCESSGSDREEVGSFDARVFSCPSETDMVRVAAWRHLHDCRRNAVNSAAASNFTHTSLQSLPLPRLLSRLALEKGIDFDRDYPKEAVWGAFLKKVPVEHVGVNGLTGERVVAKRLRCQARAIDFGQFPMAVMESVLTARYWEPEHPPGVPVELS
jgi:hypothetical protein